MKDLSKEKKELIEKLGVHYEKMGVQGVPARITALLLVSDRAELSFDEIREHLQISKSATSNGLNMLLFTGRIYYITKPGDRKRYFKNKVEQWKEIMLDDLKNSISFKDLLQEVLQVRSNKSKEFNGKLSEIIDFLSFMEEEIPRLISRWEEKNKK